MGSSLRLFVTQREFTDLLPYHSPTQPLLFMHPQIDAVKANRKILLAPGDFDHYGTIQKDQFQIT